jgi:alanine racemase
LRQASRPHRHGVVAGAALDVVVAREVGDDVVAEGDAVVLWGNPETGAPSVTEWAEWADTITYDIATGIGGRVSRFEQS